MKIVGIMMIASMLVFMFALIWAQQSFLDALLVFLVSMAVSAWVFVGVHLAFGGNHE